MRGDLPLLPLNCTGVVFNYLNQEEEEEEEDIVRVVRDTGFNTWETDGQFLALWVSRQFSFVLLVKVGKGEGKALGSKVK
jgi:hypothetical protein